MTDVDGCERKTIDERNYMVELSPTLFNSLTLNDFIQDIEEVIEMDNKGRNVSKSKSGNDSNFRHQTSVHHQQHLNQNYNHPSATASNINHQLYSSNSMAARGSVVSGAGSNQRGEPYVKILIQPAQKAHRFRYECEGRLAGCILGANSSPENKTYPTIQVTNYTGKAVVVVSCVTRDQPYRPHPHKLVGKEGCKRGICTVKFTNENMICTFSNLGIQCVKRKDIEDALKEREDHQVDPFGTTFAHKHQAGSIDLNCVRLCFQVFLEGEDKDKYTIPLKPVVSEPIYDKKAMFDLVITKLSACSASVLGGTEIILLCEKIVRDDVQVVFYEERDGQRTWEEQGDFQPTDVHKQVAISLKTPRYSDCDVHHSVDVMVQLRRPSDGAFSEGRQFTFLPAETDHEYLEGKRRKTANAMNYYLYDNTGSQRRGIPDIMGNILPPTSHMNITEHPPAPTTAQRTIKVPKPRIKNEPLDHEMSSSHYPNQPQLQNQPTYEPHVQQPFNLYPRASAPSGPFPPSMHPSAMGGNYYNIVPASSYVMFPAPTVGGRSGVSGAVGSHQDMQLQDLASMSNAPPEVITLRSYDSSTGSNPSAHLPSEHHSGESANLSFGLGSGLGSLDSISWSGISLSQIGSHLSDTFLCLNSDPELTGGINLNQEYGASTAPSSSAGTSTTTAASVGASALTAKDAKSFDLGYNQDRSREPSLDSFSRIQAQIKELNQLGGDISMSDSMNIGPN